MIVDYKQCDELSALTMTALDLLRPSVPLNNRPLREQERTFDSCPQLVPDVRQDKDTTAALHIRIGHKGRHRNSTTGFRFFHNLVASRLNAKNEIPGTGPVRPDQGVA